MGKEISSDTKDLVLVDGSSYLFRAFHALPPLVNSKNQPTGAVKGVINMIRALIKSCEHSNIAVVFDAKGKTFRNNIFKEYKANRPPMPDDLRSQIKPIHEIIAAMGLPLLVIDDVEADDVIGTLSHRASKANIDTLISTGDKDLAQLVNENVTLLNTMSNETLDIDGVVSKFGVMPDQIIDYLALMGDKSDNIPGVPGVGPKTAVKWLQQYDSMEGIIENSGSIDGKVGERLRDNINLLRLSYELATIKLDVDLEVSIDELTSKQEDKKALYTLFSELEFKTWVRELEENGISGTIKEELNKPTSARENAEKFGRNFDLKVKEARYSVINNLKDFNILVKTLEKASQFSINFELEVDHFLEVEIIGISISSELGIADYIPLRHMYENSPPQLGLDLVLEQLKPIFENKNIRKLCYDTKTIGHALQNQGIELFSPQNFDVLIASYVFNSVATKHELSDIVNHYLGLNLSNTEDLLGKGRAKLSPNQIPIEKYSSYANEKADYIYRASLFLGGELADCGNLLGIYDYYELPLTRVLRRIERNGIQLDERALSKQSSELGRKLEALEKEIHTIAGEEFNIGSPKQLQTIFYEKLSLPILKKTPTGQPSTAEPVLQELAEEYELPRLILEHRSLSKLKSTYTDKLPLQVKNSTGRVHSSFQQAVAATGRLSSIEPNLQNIPIRTEEGRRVRKAFIAEEGYKLMAADYSQVELRIMAHLSRDSGLLNAFSNNQDVHKATAADVFNVSLNKVTPEQRRRAKAINFGLIYGMSAFGLAKQLNVSRTDAQKYVERYFEKYPGVKSYMDQTKALADEKGYVETIFGRRLYLPGIRASNAMIRKAAQRTAINAPMQGSAADIIKQAMIDIDRWLSLGDLDARMLLQVHDELVFEVSENDAELLGDGVKFRMATAASLDVPLVVDIGLGNNRDEAH
ncbi:MAG: DNA polymerase I [Gammaproteobacteria bacterium]|nr:DNA polymerase I [Gammaproteobacteria bacterium]